MGFMQGALLGFVNTLVVAAAIAVSEPRPSVDVFVLVVMFGSIPGIVTGAVLGVIAGALRLRPAFRIALLLLPAVTVVALLGGAFDLDELFVPACIPTAVGVLILERSTRPSAPNLPVARSM